MTIMEHFTVELHISMQEFQAWYAGAVTSIQAVDENGLKLRFPARILRPFLRHEGIHGRFLITINENRRFHSIQQTGKP